MQETHLTTSQINLLIDCICQIYERNFKRERWDFENGHCFYFAIILKKLLQESQVCSIENHYIIKYNEEYYDYRGQLKRNEQGIIINNKLTPYKQINPIEDLEKEYDYAKSVTLVDNERTKLFQNYQKDLLKSGQNLITTFTHSKRNRTLQ